MDEIKIKAFIAINKYKSFSKAAEKFSYTPSAFSHMADALEDELSLKLFDRCRTGVTLTDEGLELLKYFENILRAEELLYTKSAELSGTNKVRIGAFSSISKNYLPKILRAFKEQNPDVKIDVTVGDNVEQLLFEDKLDVVISTYQDIPNMEWQSLFEEPFLAVFPESATAKKTIEKDELYNYPYINTHDISINKHLEVDRFPEIIYCESADYNAVISMIREGLGMSILPLIEICDGMKGLKIVSINPEFCRNVGVMYKNYSLKSKAISAFIAHLKQYANI